MNSIDAYELADKFYRPKAKLVKIAAIVIDNETGESTMLTEYQLSQFNELEFLADLTKGKAWIFRARYLPEHDDIEIEAMHIPTDSLN